MRIKRFKFSLIELLAVIALVSLLTALMLPAFRKMTAGNAVDQMASQIKLALDQAQSQAAMSRKRTALLFYLDTNVKFALAYITKDGNEYKFDRWFDNSNVLHTIEGTTIAKIQAGDANLPKVDSEVDTSNGGEIDKLYTKINSSDDKSIKFNLGTLKNDGNFFEIKDVENKNPEIRLPNSNKKLYGIVFSPFGGVENKESVSTLYIVIAEAIVLPDGEIKYLRPDGEPKSENYRLLELNNFTGRVEYK